MLKHTPKTHRGVWGHLPTVPELNPHLACTEDPMVLDYPTFRFAPLSKAATDQNLCFLFWCWKRAKPAMGTRERSSKLI